MVAFLRQFLRISSSKSIYNQITTRRLQGVNVSGPQWFSTCGPRMSTRIELSFSYLEATENYLETRKVMMSHEKCRNGTVYPQSTISRQTVPNDKVSWDVEWNEYDPPTYTSTSAMNKPWADSDISNPKFHPKWNCLDDVDLVDRRSHQQSPYEIINNIPRNPIGRTGLQGRGVLGRWGPNHAADPIVTRWKRVKENETVRLHEETNLPILQFVAIQRRDTKEWALPGGMVDPGEVVSKTLQREFEEEAMNSIEMDSERRTELHEQLKQFFSKGKEVYKGYVDDPRNTDNSWMETVAMNFHDEEGSVVGRFNLCAGDDAAKVRWMDIDQSLKLYASHIHFLEKVVQFHKAHW